MDSIAFEAEVEAALGALRRGGVILYPTDTVPGLGCDATDEAAVSRIYGIKQRPDSKSLIILVADERDVLQYTAAPDPEIFPFLEGEERPTTVIYEGAIGLAPNAIAADGSIAIRITRDPFCRHLIRRLRRPLVSTSANPSGAPTPGRLSEVDPAIRAAVDHTVELPEPAATRPPSQILRWVDGAPVWIRR